MYKLSSLFVTFILSINVSIAVTNLDFCLNNNFNELRKNYYFCKKTMLMGPKCKKYKSAQSAVDCYKKYPKTSERIKSFCTKTNSKLLNLCKDQIKVKLQKNELTRKIDLEMKVAQVLKDQVNQTNSSHNNFHEQIGKANLLIRRFSRQLYLSTYLAPKELSNELLRLKKDFNIKMSDSTNEASKSQEAIRNFKDELVNIHYRANRALKAFDNVKLYIRSEYKVLKISKLTKVLEHILSKSNELLAPLELTIVMIENEINNIDAFQLNKRDKSTKELIIESIHKTKSDIREKPSNTQLKEQLFFYMSTCKQLLSEEDCLVQEGL